MRDVALVLLVLTLAGGVLVPALHRRLDRAAARAPQRLELALRGGVASIELVRR